MIDLASLDRLVAEGARLGCGAAIVEHGRLLLIRRRKPPEASHWGFPGGKVDPGETIEQAVVREIAEELGVGIALVRQVHIVDFLDPETQQRWIAPVFLAVLERGRPVICEPEAIEALNWFALDDWPRPLTAAAVQTRPFLI